MSTSLEKPQGDELYKQLAEAINYLMEKCNENKNDFLHLPEFDADYFSRLFTFIEAAIQIQNSKKLQEAKKILVNSKNKYFDDIAKQVLNVITDEKN